jgi:hypothetical protein
MLKGAIDSVHFQRVGGWVYSEQGSVRGATVLAFVDDRCVGAGTVDLFRPDLEKAGLGDGYLGFSFAISLPDVSEIGKLAVKLENSDAFLLPRAARINTPSRFESFQASRHNVKSIDWMRSLGWVGTLEYTFLKYMLQLGVFEYSLIKQKSPSEPNSALLDPAAIATEYLRLMALSPVTVKTLASRTSTSAADIRAAVTSAVSEPEQVVAILAGKPSSISVIEGSQEDSVLPTSMDGAISYSLGPDRLVFVNLLSAFHFGTESGDIPITIFAASAS